MMRLGYLVTHPIQYQAPLLRLLAQEPDLDLNVYFQSAPTEKPTFDEGFGRPVAWDVPLVDGYSYSVLRPRPLVGLLARTPWSAGLSTRLKRDGKQVLWIHGFANAYYWSVIESALRDGLQVFVRDDIQARGNRRVGWREAVKKAALSSWSRRGVGFLAVGSLNREYYLSMGVAAENIFVAPYAVDGEFFFRGSEAARRERDAQRRALQIDDDATVVLFASKFIERKCGMDLIQAFEAALPALQAAGVHKPVLAMAGSGEEEARWRDAAQGLPVVFLGFQNQQALARLFGLVDLFVLPSRHEPWGLVVNEAMSAGLPVIVSDETGCHPDLVPDGRNGVVFPAGDRHALADALIRCLSDPARLSEMGAESRRIIAGWGFREDIQSFRQAVAWSRSRA